jgi:hypothetical protein
MAKRKHEPTESADGTIPTKPVLFETPADAERYIVSCVERLQSRKPADKRGSAVSKAAILRLVSIEHAGIDLNSLDRYLVNLLSDGRLGVTAGRWWVRRAAPVLVVGLLVLLTGCGSEFSNGASEGAGGVLVTAGGSGLPSAGAPPVAAGGATLASAGAPPVAAGGATLASAGAPPVAAGGATLASAGAPPVAAGGATLASAGAPPVAAVRWPSCLASVCGSACRTLSGSGWCEVMARCLTDHGCIASDQPNCTGCSALPDGIDCECAP